MFRDILSPLLGLLPLVERFDQRVDALLDLGPAVVDVEDVVGVPVAGDGCRVLLQPLVALFEVALDRLTDRIPASRPAAARNFW